MSGVVGRVHEWSALRATSNPTRESSDMQSNGRSEDKPALPLNHIRFVLEFAFGEALRAEIGNVYLRFLAHDDLG